MKIFLRVHRPQQHHGDGFLERGQSSFLAFAGHFGELIVVARQSQPLDDAGDDFLRRRLLGGLHTERLIVEG